MLSSFFKHQFRSVKRGNHGHLDHFSPQKKLDKYLGKDRDANKMFDLENVQKALLHRHEHTPHEYTDSRDHELSTRPLPEPSLNLP